MRRRTRIDLGQQPNTKEESVLARKKQRWDERNKHRPDENPFLAAMNPNHEHYGEPDEKDDELKARLFNLEFGNFPGYFNYRNKAATGEDTADANRANPLDAGLSDERLKCFKREWFHNKEVLDIGCNRGHVTYAIARMFSPKSIVGIDIDLKMINMANKDLHLNLEDGILKEARERRLKRAAEQRLDEAKLDLTYQEETNLFPLSCYISHGPLIASTGQVKADTDDEADDCDSNERFPNNLIFVEHNYVLSNDVLVSKQKPHFDAIVCLSVTKWIHLNYRDEGLKRFFRRIYNHLRPGGLLILEAQPFDNYGRRRKLSERLKSNFYSIQFKPDSFDAYLLSEEVGFKNIIYESVTEHECAGFKRPLKVYQK